MPRLTDLDYLRNHELLRTNRGSDDTAFVMLSASEQWNLFSYYLPHEARSATDLLIYRREISKLDPSLPHRAGRALQHMLRLQTRLPEYRQLVATQPPMKKNAKKRIFVFGAVKPQLDAEQFAKILIRAATEAAHRDVKESAARTTLESEHPASEAGSRRSGR